MERLISSIESYIKYLISEGLSVSVHFTPESIGRLPFPIWKRLLPYNSHNNLYCLYVKSRGAEKCIAHQRKIISECTSDGCVRECHACVAEYTVSVELSGEYIGYVAVSGYRGTGKSGVYDESRASSLKREDIPTALCDTLIPPLCIMLSDLFALSRCAEPNEYNMISQYLAENHTNADFTEFCRHFSRSKSYMSHTFSKVFGKSFSDYCNDLKLEDARRMLLITDESVTDIALASGFGDVSYFIRLFKSRYGTTPKKYRGAGKIV